ncbi:MAG TPA: hypothetical protein VF771_15480 [Longimicrobiaceae bacterium]
MRRFFACSLAAALALSACTSWRPQTAPAPEVVAAHGNGSVRVLRRDMSTIELRNPQVLGDSIVGEAGDPPRRAAIAIADVQRIDVRRVSATRTGGLTLAVLVVASAVAVVAVLAAVLGGWE